MMEVNLDYYWIKHQCENIYHEQEQPNIHFENSIGNRNYNPRRKRKDNVKHNKY